MSASTPARCSADRTGQGFVSDARIHDCASGNPLQLEIYEYLRPADCVAGTFEEAFAECVHRAVEFGSRHAMVDESDLFRLPGCQQFAR